MRNVYTPGYNVGTTTMDEGPFTEPITSNTDDTGYENINEKIDQQMEEKGCNWEKTIFCWLLFDS